MTVDGARPTDPSGRAGEERPGEERPGEEPPGPRPWLERIGLAMVALVLAILFAALGVAAWIGGELFLAVMAGSGALMTLWAAGNTLRRG